MDGPKNATATWATQFLLTLQGDPQNVTNLTGAGWYNAGSLANFSAPSTLSSGQDTRLIFGSWSGDYVGQVTNGSAVMDRPKVLTAHFITQYLLDVTYDPPSIVTSYNETHAGWYAVNSYVQLGPVPNTIDVSSVERLRFIGWIDNGHSSSNMSVSVVVNQPHKVVLSYLTQYYVDVESTYGSTSGSGWYDRGTTAQIGVTGTETWPISYTLSGWNLTPPTGSITQTGNSWALVVDKPYVVQAVWNVDYFPLILLIGGSGVGISVLVAAAVVTHRRRTKRSPVAKRPSAMRKCMKCGADLPAGATFCQRCGTSQEPQPQPSSVDVEKVYNYIVNHEGVISLSKAAQELGITVEKLKEITEKLKKEGRLA
jgi:ribosomal protein L40E